MNIKLTYRITFWHTDVALITTFRTKVSLLGVFEECRFYAKYTLHFAIKSWGEGGYRLQNPEREIQQKVGVGGFCI